MWHLADQHHHQLAMPLQWTALPAAATRCCHLQSHCTLHGLHVHHQGLHKPPPMLPKSTQHRVCLSTIPCLYSLFRQGTAFHKLLQNGTDGIPSCTKSTVFTHSGQHCCMLPLTHPGVAYQHTHCCGRVTLHSGGLFVHP